jgi:hypothetical protein
VKPSSKTSNATNTRVGDKNRHEKCKWFNICGVVNYLISPVSTASISEYAVTFVTSVVLSSISYKTNN